MGSARVVVAVNKTKWNVSSFITAPIDIKATILFLIKKVYLTLANIHEKITSVCLKNTKSSETILRMAYVGIFYSMFDYSESTLDVFFFERAPATLRVAGA